MKLRVMTAVLACKLCRALIRLLGRGGTDFPGRVALKLCPNLLGELARNVTTVIVTGTNGKTTTSRMIEQSWQDAGISYFANKSGANLLSGVKVIVYTNVFRDQLDRYGEVTHTLSKLRIGAQNSPNAVLCLNADDSLITSLHDDVPNPVIFYGVSTPLYEEQVSDLSDAPYCIKCKSEYQYDFVTYGHLGGYRCLRCGYARPKPDICVSKVILSDEERSEVVFRDGETEIPATVNLPGGYNIYNACAAMAAAKAMGLELPKAAQSLSRFACGFGRMEKFEINGTDVRMILIKNPAGCNQVLSFLTQRTEPFVFAACLNDRTQDGRDVSWIWDVAFERLTDMGDTLREVYLSGTRAEDMALRFLYAGFPKEKLHVQKDYGALMEEATAHKLPVFVMPTYTAMLALRGTISKTYGYKQFWE